MRSARPTSRHGQPKRRRARRWALGAAGALVLLGGAAKTGWLSAPRPWQQATGWSRLPAELRPPQGRLWTAADDGAAPLVRWLGHSGFLLRWHGVTLLIDPNVSARCTISRRVLRERPDLGEVGPVDAALISHGHYDHLDLPSLASVPRLERLVVPLGAEAYLEEADWGATTIRSVRPGDSIRLGELEIVAVGAAHNGNRHHPLQSRELAVGYVVRTSKDAIYYAGDTGERNDFASIRRRYHPRAALLPIGAYSPRWPMQRYHLSPEGAVRVARELGVEVVVPCHFGTYTLSLDRPADALPRFARAAAAADVEWRMPRLLEPARPTRAES